MKALTFPAFFGALALLLASCDKPKVAAPPPGDEGQFSNSGATAVAAKMRSFSVTFEAAQQDKDPSKIPNFLAQARTLMSEVRSCAANVKPEELAQLSARVENCLEPVASLSKSLAPDAVFTFTSELAYTRQTLADIAAANLSKQKMTEAQSSSRVDPAISYKGAPAGSAGFGSLLNDPDRPRPPVLQQIENPSAGPWPVPGEAGPSSPEPPPLPESK